MPPTWESAGPLHDPRIHQGGGEKPEIVINLKIKVRTASNNNLLKDLQADYDPCTILPRLVTKLAVLTGFLEKVLLNMINWGEGGGGGQVFQDTGDLEADTIAILFLNAFHLRTEEEGFDAFVWSRERISFPVPYPTINSQLYALIYLKIFVESQPSASVCLFNSGKNFTSSSAACAVGICIQSSSTRLVYRGEIYDG